MANFTDTYIRRLRPSTKRIEKFEGGGFGILLYPSGTKSWIYRYKIGNKRDYIIFGHYPAMSLSDARKRFHELKEIRRTGTNPKQALQEARSKKTLTVEDLCQTWYSNYIEKNRKRPEQIRKQIDSNIIPLLGGLSLDAIQPIHITEALDTIVQRGAPIHANRILSSLKQLFSYAVSRGSMHINPALNILARNIGGLEKPKDRYLSLDEIRRIWHFLDSNRSQMSLQTKGAIKMIILTGVRTAEIRLAQWAHIDFKNSLWVVPPENTKGTLTIKIHLTELAKSVLQQLRDDNESSYVLPGQNPDKPIDENVLPRAIRRIQNRVGIPEWTAHDLRRTFATQLGEALHIDPVVIEKCLGHKMPRIMATYNKNEMLPQRRDALEKWSTCVIDLIEQPIVYNEEVNP